MSVEISGFTIVRNAIKLEYPFRESVLSVLPLVDEFIINCGFSEDETAKVCESIVQQSGGKVRVIYTNWETSEQKGGLQLSLQSDAAQALCKGRWCFYIQADEVIHEEDFDRIRTTLKNADARADIDGLLFDWRHFYGNFEYVITGRNWYRREVRLFKNHRGIHSFRDAQGFRKDNKRLRVLHSGARVFHYGYVRSPQSLKAKSKEMSLWWGEEPVTDLDALQLRRHVGLREFKETHPAVMNERIGNNALYFDPTRCQRKWDRDEIKNALTFLWEAVIPYRIGEFRNYEWVRD